MDLGLISDERAWYFLASSVGFWSVNLSSGNRKSRQTLCPMLLMLEKWTILLYHAQGLDNSAWRLYMLRISFGNMLLQFVAKQLHGPCSSLMCKERRTTHCYLHALVIAKSTYLWSQISLSLHLRTDSLKDPAARFAARAPCTHGIYFPYILKRISSL